MRRGWNGITISRDTIHIEGVKLGEIISPLLDQLIIRSMSHLILLGFDRPVLFERHAVGGEYGAG